MKNRLSEIYEAASNLFINKGYSRTQMKDIAKDINLSTGMLYMYFTGKKDLLNFTLKATIEPNILNALTEFPIDGKQLEDIESEIRGTLQLHAESFSRGFDENKLKFEEMLSYTFDLISQYGKGLLIIEKNPDDVGQIFKDYIKYRETFFDQMLKYIKYYQSQGSCRKLEYPESSTILIIETISWWAMHLRNDTFSPQKNISVEEAKAVCLDNLVNAYKIS